MKTSIHQNFRPFGRPATHPAPVDVGWAQVHHQSETKTHEAVQAARGLGGTPRKQKPTCLK